MGILEAVILGIVEGITEFLPVSSTGHLILTAELLGLTDSDFLKSFEIVIQLGAMLSIVVLYGRSLLKDREVWKRILAAFIPTAVIGGLFYRVVKSVFMGNHHLVLWMLFWGGVFLVLFDRRHKESNDAIDDVAKIPYKTAVIIGLFQSLAIIPGISRSAATIIGGLIFGIKRKTIVEFSFLLALPTMLAATGLDLVMSSSSFRVDQLMLLGVGLAVSFCVAILSVKFLLHYIQRHDFVAFGIYRIVVSVVWWILGK
jgi:undecaprenyl-diphosphatase